MRNNKNKKKQNLKIFLRFLNNKLQINLSKFSH